MYIIEQAAITFWLSEYKKEEIFPAIFKISNHESKIVYLMKQMKQFGPADKHREQFTSAIIQRHAQNFIKM